MDDPRPLYDRDFYAWTQDQAARLRAWPEAGRPNALDLDHIAEEIEDSGKRDRREVESLLHQIALHLLKLEWHPAQAARHHWQTEIDGFRDRLERVLDDSPSLRARLPELYAAEWLKAARRFLRLIGTEVGDAAAARLRPHLDGPPRFDLPGNILDPEWWPSFKGPAEDSPRETRQRPTRAAPKPRPPRPAARPRR